MKNKIIEYIFEDYVFSANFCYFDKPIFPYTNQQAWGVLRHRYSIFELKKIHQLHKEYKALKMPLFGKIKVTRKTIYTKTTNRKYTFEIKEFRLLNYASIYVNGYLLPKNFKNTAEAKQYILTYYPRLLIKKKHLIF